MKLKQIVIASLVSFGCLAALVPTPAAAAPHHGHKVCRWDAHHHHKSCHWVR